MNLTLRQLRYFVEIARCRSFSRAAEHLAVAQPALSQNIAALEDELGARLFERHARGVNLSPAGQRLFDRAVDLLAGADALKDQVEGRHARPAGTVRLSIAGSLGAVLIAPLLAASGERYPDIELQVTEGLSYDSRSHVESGQAHLALMPAAAELQDVHSLPVFEERFLLFGPPAALQQAAAEVPFAQLAQCVLAVPDRAHDIRKVIERAASAQGLALDVRYELNSPALVVAVVKAGLAHTVLPQSICEEAIAAGSIVGRPIVAPALTRVQSLVWRRDRPLAPAADALRHLLVELIGTLVRSGRLQGRLLAGEP